MAPMRNQRQVLGGAIRRIREAKGLTLQDLATRVEVNIGYLSHIEAGHRQPSPHVTAKLANALSIDLDDISYNANIYVVAEDDIDDTAARQLDLEILANARRREREEKARQRAAKRAAEAEDPASASA